MLKVFLVEDEVVVREGIKNNINWTKNGFEFCGEASDGELAYPMIQKIKPDIIITDIKMPFMNGLELSRLVRKEMPHIKIIILSGHEEFEFAKEAINIGVEEYLLKPINGAELVSVVKKVGDILYAEQEERVNMERFKREMKENETEAKRKLFNSMISSSQSLSHVLEKGQELRIDLSASNYNIILFKASRIKHNEEEFSDTILTIYEMIGRLFESEKHVILFNRNIEGLALLVMGSTEDELEAVQNNYIDKIDNILNKYEDVTYFGGIGAPVKRLRELSHSFEEASRAFACRFIIEKSCFLDCTKISEQGIQQEQPAAGFDALDVGKLDKKKIESFLRSGDREEIRYFVEGYIRNIGEVSHESLIFRQYIVIDMYLTIMKFIEELARPTDSLREMFKDSSRINAIMTNIKEMQEFIIVLFEKAIKCRDEIATKKYSAIIELAKEYIIENYSNEELSLNVVASSVNISPSHLSAVFSQETGQTFVKFMTDIRMNKAKELLKCTNMKSSVISAAVGYKDPHYFSYLFKKTQKCTPMQYRNNMYKTRGGEEYEPKTKEKIVSENSR